MLVLFVTNVEGRQATSKNNVTDFFNKEIENRQGLDSCLDSAKSRAQEGIKGKQGATELGMSEAEMEQKTSELDSIGANDLETAGMQERAKPENAYYNSLEVNYDDPQVINHHRDIDRIVKGTEDMVKNLLEGLRDYNVDCKTVKGDKEIEPQYFIDVKQQSQEDTVYNSFTDVQQRQQKDTIYNKKICEQLRNQYDCRDQLIVRCLDFAEQPARFEITGSSIPYRAIPNGSITSYEFSNRGNIGGSSTVGGGIRRGGFGNNALRAIGLGVNRGSTTTLSASTVGVSFSFNIKIPAATVGRLEIVNLQFTSVVQIKINGSNVVVAPGGGYTLDLAGYHEEVRKGKRKFGGVAGPRVRHVTLYPIVTTGSTTHILGKINANNSWGRVDLLPYLRDGGNTVEVKVIGLDQAFVSFVLNTSERICRNWHKEWEEICTLR